MIDGTVNAKDVNCLLLKPKLYRNSQLGCKCRQHEASLAHLRLPDLTGSRPS